MVYIPISISVGRLPPPQPFCSLYTLYRWGKADEGPNGANEHSSQLYASFPREFLHHITAAAGHYSAQFWLLLLLYCCWARSLIPPLSQTTFLSIHLCWHHGREREMGGRPYLMSYHIYREKKYRRSGRLYSVLFFFSAHSLMQMLRSNIYRGSLIIRG